jgi:hypothetical protein
MTNSKAAMLETITTGQNHRGRFISLHAILFFFPLNQTLTVYAIQKSVNRRKKETSLNNIGSRGYFFFFFLHT